MNLACRFTGDPLGHTAADNYDLAIRALGAITWYVTYHYLHAEKPWHGPGDALWDLSPAGPVPMTSVGLPVLSVVVVPIEYSIVVPCTTQKRGSALI